MKILSVIARCLEKLTITGACRFVESIMQNVIIKDVVSGPVMILRRLLNALNVRRDFISITPELIAAETRLAELHQILLIKQENHTLTSDDERWLADTQEFFDKRAKQLDVKAVRLHLIEARLVDKPYISTITGTEVNLAFLHHAKKALDNSKK